ncbi:zinc-binding dehydrogenase [Klebsiella variicola subsp. variicola]|nr:zinc-binding dehydrogenase [Klebsiella variicola subsp. variicola]
MKGARVIGTTGSPEKVATARLAGASEVLLHTDAAWPDKVRDITEGYGVHLAIDGIGGTMLSRTLGVVRPFWHCRQSWTACRPHTSRAGGRTGICPIYSTDAAKFTRLFR